MKRIFSIEYPGELGEMWLNKDNLMACLSAYCHGVEFSVEDLTDDILALKGETGDALENFKAEHAALKTRAEAAEHNFAVENDAAVAAEEALEEFRAEGEEVKKKFHGTS